MMARLLLKVAGSCTWRMLMFTFRPQFHPTSVSRNCWSSTPIYFLCARSDITPSPCRTLSNIHRFPAISASNQSYLNVSTPRDWGMPIFRLISSKSNGENDQEHQNVASSSSDGTNSDSDSSSESEATSSERNRAAVATQPVSDIDVDRELLRYDYENFELKPDEEAPEVVAEQDLPISLDRGETGVFDVEELVELLRDENGRDICVMRVPKELDYVDYMVLVTGRSTRHLRAMAEYIKWTYKRKRSDQDPASVKIEGELTNDWFALDLGNIAVHLFLRSTRRLYDLETLWTVGVEHDEKCRADITDIQSSQQHENFSFDVELERLRKLRVSPTDDKNDGDAVDGKLNLNSSSLENAAGWHQTSGR